MRAGPGLNALIAEKVMGWPLQDAPPFASPHCSWNKHESCPDTLWVIEQSADGVIYSSFSPSTNMANAWQVMEKVKGWSWDDQISFGIAISKGMGLGDEDYGYGAFVRDICMITPLAICLAALQVVEAQVGRVAP